ncbi:AAA family ATPase [Polaribacter sp. R2A056_3_33]|uniref:AAA domain-containing protein n=1 Tax=Polaribacter sp. R2A056_3_33 TaxID=2745563 RepID=UPI001C4FEE42|nr:AAA domain-containing protein [Polaribacter sp. R2A056_3_33]QXP69312.1 AAA family ATPase [Polaribacter sp. R2A056_3_33]
MEHNNLGIYYLDELSEIYFDDTLSIISKYSRLRNLLDKICKELSKNELVNFSNLFSRVTFIIDKYQTSRKIHRFRIASNEVIFNKKEVIDNEYKTHIMYFVLFIENIFNCNIPKKILQGFPKEEFINSYKKRTDKNITELRVEIVEIQNNFLICDYEENKDEDFIKVSINNEKFNNEFNNVDSFWKNAQINLVNIEVDEKGIFYPTFIILEPDYLVDVSAIAECFQDFGSSELNYIKSKFEEIPNSKYIRLGNFANLVMDKLFSRENNEIIEFINVLKEDFKQYPIEYAACNDLNSTDNFQQYIDNARVQFNNIKNVVENNFVSEAVNINVKTATLEPTFLNKRYGIQGRLDIFQSIPKEKGVSKIIELKSGGTPFPDNGTSIKPNHQAQLFLYYQLVGSINNLNFSEISKKTKGFILYSKVNTNNLRNDEIYLKKVQEILNLRNAIVINEFRLGSDNLVIIKELINSIVPDNIIKNSINPNFRKLLEPQILQLNEKIIASSELEQKYFYSFISFISREQYLSKLGNGQYETSNGLANLWLNQFNEKIEKFEIIYDLVIEENKADTKDLEIIFSRTNSDNKFVNFRKGDICVLYPRNNTNNIATDNQIFKCNIKSITTNKVVVGFRYKQNNLIFFERYHHWAIERDFMDASFNSMYKNLYSFITANKVKRKLLLAIDFPKILEEYSFNKKHLSVEQNRIISKALSANDYFLLNGPPGTGKTSIIIKELVKEILLNSDSKILLLAYTNRAVDELCEAVTDAVNEIINNSDITNENKGYYNFIRIGSELSCNDKYKNNLLSVACKNIGNRSDLKQFLSSKRIYISTVASISSKTHLFKLVNFDKIIIDEASQILEPQIIGILPKGKSFIMIGDHKQLPAIVLQDSVSTLTNEKQLEQIGLVNRKNSLFERLFKYCEKNNIKHAFDTLTYQGRMHKEIALFPNHSFYNSILKEAYNIPNLDEDIKKTLERQVAKLKLKSTTKNTLEDLLTKKRILFFPSKTDEKNHFSKSNEHEANLVTKIIEEVIKIYNYNNKVFSNKKSIGVIATYRNQIAIIKQKLEEANIPDYEDITVDTVERFQGSQRDIIIVSFAINNHYQLNGLVNLNDEGTVDRKLNVALTRAKEQLIIIGNDDILSSSLIYYKLIEFVKSQGGYVWDKIEDVILGNLHFNYFNKINTVEGRTYQPDDEFKNTFDDLIINPLKTDERTIEYPNLILGQTNNFIRNNIIEYGRADFDIVFAYQTNLFTQEFSVKDKVMLYCYYNMRKHYFSNKAVFETFNDFFKIELKQVSNRITFLDFGCGPLTAGIAFNQFAKKIDKNFKMNYVGIDISNGMIDMATEFSQSLIFNSNSTFNFYHNIKEIEQGVFDELFELSNVVVLNFSYLFANLNLEQTITLANDISELIEKHPLNKYILIYQNPVNKFHNFSKFKNIITNLNNVIVRKSETVSYRNTENSWYDTSETFTYEIITN